mmetsp:Transcript_60060/g.159640  ORF Transcript_60060/g.159640 Transcript_60060/m.159640 type:complete len:869 (+) Transcript_60060:62-2668(+)
MPTRIIFGLVAFTLVIFVKAQVDYTRSGSYLSFNPPPTCADNTYDCYFKFTRSSNAADSNVSALFQAFPHFTLNDTSNLLLAPTAFSIELMVRIRDRRLLVNGTNARSPPGDRYIPLLGNLQLLDNSGYELACQRRFPSAVCCMRVFQQAVPSVVESCVDVTSLVSDWFYISASFNSVHSPSIDISAYSPYRSTTVIRGPHVIVSGPINVGSGQLAFRIGMQIPFQSNGGLLNGYAEFFTGDLDEIKIWKSSTKQVGLEVAQNSDYSSLYLYIPVRYRINNGTNPFTDSNIVVQDLGQSPQIRGPSIFNSKPALSGSLTSALSTARAWNITLLSDTTTQCNPQQIVYLVPAWYKPCFSNYLDQRADLRVGSLNFQAELLDPSQSTTASPYWRTVLLPYVPSAQARILVVDVNPLDVLTNDPAIYLNSDVTLGIENGLPFASSDLTKTDSSAQVVLASKYASVVSPANSGAQPCNLCVGTAQCNCLEISLTLQPMISTCSPTCPSGLSGDPTLMLLCYDWWVPATRGWSLSFGPIEHSTLYTGYQYTYRNRNIPNVLPDAMQILLGYEASPEWITPENIPVVSAYSCSVVSYLQDSGDPDNVQYVVVPGNELVVYLRARDRNLGDAVDIVPLDDPGLPNGARLCPALFYDSADAQSQCDPKAFDVNTAYQTPSCLASYSALDARFETMQTFRGPLGFKAQCLEDGDRLFATPRVKENAPRYWDRTFIFTPAASQTGALFHVKFVAASYPSPSCAGSDWMAGQACAQTVTGSFPSGGTYPYSSELSRTQRTFSIRVPNPVVDFTSPTPADGSQQVFVSGCSFGSLRLFVEGSSEGRAADYNASMASVNSTSQRVSPRLHPLSALTALATN